MLYVYGRFTVRFDARRWNMLQERDLYPWDRFILASMDLNGLKLSKDGEQRSTEMDRYRKLAESLFANPWQFVPSRLINGALLGHHTQGLRRGTEYRQRGKVPDAADLERILDNFDRQIVRRLKMFKSAKPRNRHSWHRREEFCWWAHDELRGINPFQLANGQTARYMLNHLRVLLGLPILVLNDDNAGDYHRRLDEYCEKVYIPRLRSELPVM